MSRVKTQIKKPSRLKSVKKKIPLLRIPKGLASEFPETAPIVSAEQMFCGDYADSNEKPTKCCLLGHLNLWLTGKPWSSPFPNDDNMLQGLPFKALINASIVVLGDDSVCDCDSDLDKINDGGCLDISNQTGVPVADLQARIWNLGMAILGYVVGNPEAKHVQH